MEAGPKQANAVLDGGTAAGRLIEALPRRIDDADRRRWTIVFAVTMAIGLLAYLSLWTDILLTNHSLPNAWANGYPSFKTRYEGRWLADIIIQFAGGSGVQQLQFVAALAIKAVNALLLCRLVGLRRTGDVVLVAAVLALHPAFLDYYSFTIDATTFEIGDTLALLVALSLRLVAPPSFAAALAAGGVCLSLAAYQPKIALVAVVLLLWLANGAPRERGAPTQARG